MFTLVYRSVVSPSLDNESLEKMLFKARDFNESKNITGCLLHHKGEIIQLLEGGRAEVKSLFDKIKKDERHTNIIVLNMEETFFRIFENWSMIYKDAGRSIYENSKKREQFEYVYKSSQSIYLPSKSKITLWTEVNSILDQTVMYLN